MHLYSDYRISRLPIGVGQAPAQSPSSSARSPLYAVGGAVIGAGVGALFAGAKGAAVGAVIGGGSGFLISPKEADAAPALAVASCDLSKASPWAVQKFGRAMIMVVKTAKEASEIVGSGVGDVVVASETCEAFSWVGEPYPSTTGSWKPNAEWTAQLRAFVPATSSTPTTPPAATEPAEAPPISTEMSAGQGIDVVLELWAWGSQGWVFRSSFYYLQKGYMIATPLTDVFHELNRPAPPYYFGREWVRQPNGRWVIGIELVNYTTRK